MKKIKILLIVTLLLIVFPELQVEAKNQPDLTLLFTTDIHSNAIEHTALIDGTGQEVGGYARLKSAVDANKTEGRTLLLDSGDYSMGTLYQSFTKSDAFELTVMQKIGYDAVALGNHDFEVTEDGLRDELEVFHNNGGTFPLLCTNLIEGNNVERNENPLYSSGVNDYVIIEKNGYKIGVFSLIGENAQKYTPVSTLGFADPIETARKTVKLLKEKETVDLVILLDHVGTVPDGSFHEDADIAKAVDGIDIILSGHMHMPLKEEQVVNNTKIVCAGTGLAYLGKMNLYYEEEGWKSQYELLPFTEEWDKDEEINSFITPYMEKLDTEYFAIYGVTVGQGDTIAYSPYDFTDGDVMCYGLDNYSIGALITDGYLDTLKDLGMSDVNIGMSAVGCIRGGLYKGKLKMADVYNVLSYGISPNDESCASPMVTVCMNGQELYDMCEISVSLSPIINGVQILMGGMRYEYSNERPLLNKVYKVETYNPDSDSWEKVERNDKRLYKVACSWQAMQSVGLVKNSSYGLLSIEPKDEQGNILDTLEKQKSRIVYLENGAELKEWYTLYHYITKMEKREDGLPVIMAKYGEPAQFLHSTGFSLLTFFRSPSKVAWIQYGIVLVLLFVIVTLIRIITKRKRLRKRRT